MRVVSGDLVLHFAAVEAHGRTKLHFVTGVIAGTGQVEQRGEEIRP